MNEITRFRGTVAITANSSAASTSGYIGFGPYAGGCVVIAATNSCTQINWYAAANAGDTPVQVYADGSAVTTALTVGVHPIPDACYAASLVVPVVTGGTTCAMTALLKG